MLNLRKMTEVTIYIVMVSIIFALFHYKLHGFTRFVVTFIALIMMFSVKKKTFNNLFIVIGIIVFLPLFNRLIPILHLRDETFPMRMLLWSELIIPIVVYLIVSAIHQAKKTSLFSPIVLFISFVVLYVVYMIALLDGVGNIIFNDIDFQRVLDIIRTLIVIPLAFSGYLVAFGFRLWLSIIKPKPIEIDPYEQNILNKKLL